jgi:hypothetical protein
MNFIHTLQHAPENSLPRAAAFSPPRKARPFHPGISGLPSACLVVTILIHLRATNAPLNFACGSKK